MSGGAAQFISFWRKQITPQEHTEAITGIPEEFFFLWNRNGALEIGGRRRTLDWQSSSGGGAYLAPAVVSRREINHQIILACLLHQDFWVARQGIIFEGDFFAGKKLYYGCCCQVVVIGYKSNRKVFCYYFVPLCWAICRVRDGYTTLGIGKLQHFCHVNYFTFWGHHLAVCLKTLHTVYNVPC